MWRWLHSNNSNSTNLIQTKCADQQFKERPKEHDKKCDKYLTFAFTMCNANANRAILPLNIWLNANLILCHFNIFNAKYMWPSHRDAIETATVLYNQVEERVHTLVMRSNQSMQHLDLLSRLRDSESKLNTVCWELTITELLNGGLDSPIWQKICQHYMYGFGWCDL